MYIDIHILFYLLKEKSVSLVEKKALLPFRLSNIQQIIPGHTNYTAQKLYICTWEEYLLLPDCSEAAHFAISGIINKELIYKRKHHVLHFPPDLQPADLIEQIQEKWENYTRWYDNTMDFIHNGSTLQEVFNAAVSILDFPIALFDKYSLLIAAAGKIPEIHTNTIWNDVLENHHYPNDEISPEMTRKTYERMIKNVWPIQYYSKKHREFHLISAIILQNRFFGVIGSSSKEKFTEGQLSIFWQIKFLLEYILMQNIQRSTPSDEAPYYIERMLSGYQIDESTVGFLLNSLNWKINEEYRVICIKHMNNAKLYADVSMNYMITIHELFPISISFYYENSIICIVKTFGKHYKATAAFEHFLLKQELQAGVSLEFGSFMLLKYAYIQCKHALLSGKSAITEFKDIYNHCLIQTLEQSTSLKSLCHPSILQYWQTGHEREKEYIRCLKVYLLNGRNITDSAQKLNLHRNTLIYRLDYMSKLLTTDLRGTCLSDDYISLLIFSCNIVEHLEK